LFNSKISGDVEKEFTATLFVIEISMVPKKIIVKEEVFLPPTHGVWGWQFFKTVAFLSHNRKISDFGKPYNEKPYIQYLTHHLKVV